MHYISFILRNCTSLLYIVIVYIVIVATNKDEYYFTNDEESFFFHPKLLVSKSSVTATSPIIVCIFPKYVMFHRYFAGCDSGSADLSKALFPEVPQRVENRG